MKIDQIKKCSQKAQYQPIKEDYGICDQCIFFHRTLYRCKNMYAHCITHNYDNIYFLIICQLDENDISNDTFEQYKSDKVSNCV